jgi:uncharacterized membrane protein (DUF2068 family)
MERAEQPPPIAPPVITQVRRPRAPTLIASVIFKLLKGALLLTAAGMFFSLVGVDLQQEFNRMLAQANFDPGGQMFGDFARWLQTVTPATLRLIGVGAIFYSAFSLVEGTGLWLRAGWAGWMAIGESACFIPVELYQMINRYSNLLALILVSNVLIVWYLYGNRNRLFEH